MITQLAADAYQAGLDAPLYSVTRDDVLDIAQVDLEDEDFDRVAQAIPLSSIPEAVGVVIDAVANRGPEETQR